MEVLYSVFSTGEYQGDVEPMRETRYVIHASKGAASSLCEICHKEARPVDWELYTIVTTGSRIQFSG